MKKILSFKLKCLPEDFHVTEVPLIPQMSSASGKFTYIWLVKSGLTTFDAVDKVASFFRLAPDDVAHQGLKDEDAITEQIISVKKKLQSKSIDAFNKKYAQRDAYVRIVSVFGYGDEPVQGRMLHGNTFRVVVRDLQSGVAKRLCSGVAESRYYTFINYYDNQRFGLPGGPYLTHRIGGAIVNQDWDRALAYLIATHNLPPREKMYGAKSVESKAIIRQVGHKRLAFFVAAYNSYLWNRHASKLVGKYSKSETYAFMNVGMLRVPLGGEPLLPSLGAVNGYALMERKLVVRRVAYRRALAVGTIIYAEPVEDDELHARKKKVTLSFFLPAGSYATMLVKQVLLRFAE